MPVSTTIVNSLSTMSVTVEYLKHKSRLRKTTLFTIHAYLRREKKMRSSNLRRKRSFNPLFKRIKDLIAKVKGT